MELARHRKPETMTRCSSFVLAAMLVFSVGCDERSAAKNSVAQRQTPMQPNDEIRPESNISGHSAGNFPLASSSRWEYDVEIQGPQGTSQKFSAVKSVKDQRHIGTHQYTRIVTELSGDSIHVPDQFYRVDDDGVKAAVQGAEGKELLLLPSNPRSKKSWGGEADPAIAGFSGEATVDEVFEHRDRRYNGCVKVSVKMSVVEASVFGRRETPVHLQRWFAPGIGMVRELRILGEEGKPNYMKSDCKLTGFHIGP